MQREEIKDESKRLHQKPGREAIDFVKSAMKPLKSKQRVKAHKFSRTTPIEKGQEKLGRRAE
jgi:hypothetical protein